MFLAERFYPANVNQPLYKTCSISSGSQTKQIKDPRMGLSQGKFRLEPPSDITFLDLVRLHSSVEFQPSSLRPTPCTFPYHTRSRGCPRLFLPPQSYSTHTLFVQLFLLALFIHRLTPSRAPVLHPFNDLHQSDRDLPKKPSHHF